jgi:hypothetical protein
MKVGIAVATKGIQSGTLKRSELVLYLLYLGSHTGVAWDQFVRKNQTVCCSLPLIGVLGGLKKYAMRQQRCTLMCVSTGPVGIPTSNDATSDTIAEVSSSIQTNIPAHLKNRRNRCRELVILPFRIPNTAR